MSRKCPKRNHLFLNWLKANRSRFPFQLRITSQRKRRIDFDFLGITYALKFGMEFTGTNGPWIAVDAVWPGMEPEGLVRFFGAETITDNGWVSLRQLPENIRYWRTREDLWKELCFEAFLTWCNNELAEANWLEFYKIGDRMSGAKLHKEPSITDSYMDIIRDELGRDGIILPNGENFFVLVRTDLSDGRQ